MVTEFSFLHYDDKELFATLATGRGNFIAYKLYNKVFVAKFNINWLIYQHCIAGSFQQNGKMDWQ